MKPLNEIVEENKKADVSTKQFITVALKIEYNECDNPYPVQDENYKPRQSNALQEAQDWSDAMFDMHATHTIIIELGESK